MTNNAIAVKDEQVSRPQRDVHGTGRSARRLSWGWLVVVLVVLGFGGVGGVWLTAVGQQHKKESEKEAAARSKKSSVVTVQVIKPARGGMARGTRQPGTIRAFEFAALYTKVSGFVKTLKVDRGSRVKKGDLLAE